MLLWFGIVGLLPLILVLLLANQYYRSVYLAEVDDEMQMELDRLGASIKQQLQYHQNLLRTLASSAQVNRFANALGEAVTDGQVGRDYGEIKRRLELFLLNLQPVVAERATIRLLDGNGNTVMRVNYGGFRLPELEGLPPYPLFDVEADSDLAMQLARLPEGEVSYLRLPPASDRQSPLLDAVWPVEQRGYRLYLVFSSDGERIDRLLALMPRLREAKISIVEVGRSSQEPLHWIYNDDPPVKLTGEQREPVPVPPVLQLYAENDAETVKVEGGKRWYLGEFYPYHDRLLSWILALRVEGSRLAGQFRLISYGLLALTLLVALLSFLLANLAARRLSRPVTQLARNLRSYALGVPMTSPLRTWSSEMNELDRSFRQMVANLERARQARSQAEQRLVKSARLASIGEMAAGIGHELNNPLTNILSLAKLIRRHAKTCPDVVEDAEEIINETQRAAHIVRGILNFARQIEPVYSMIDARGWLESCIQRVQTFSDAKAVTFRLECPDSLAFEADRYQMEQVMLNLLQNAIHASPVGGVVEVLAKEVSGWFVLQVTDAGGGIDPAIAGRVFEPFVTSKPVGEGSGLGLSISLGIVEIHGGRLQLSSNEGGGATAEIRIPMRKSCP